MQITLTERQCEQLASLKRAREASGRGWPGDEHMALSILSRGIVDELDDERFIGEVLTKGPLDLTNDAGKFGVLQTQAV